MRTTLTLDPDVAVKAHMASARLRRPFKDVVNHALRVGLDEVLASPFSRPHQTQPQPLGLRGGLNYDDITKLLTASEGAKHR